jgi:hypothetical protein
MKKLLVVAALGTFIAAPAFAQHDPNDPNDPRAGHRIRAFDQQQRSTIPLYVGDIYYGRNGNTNPEFQLGGDRWRALHRKRPVARSVSRQ